MPIKEKYPFHFVTTKHNILQFHNKFVLGRPFKVWIDNLFKLYLALKKSWINYDTFSLFFLVSTAEEAFITKLFKTGTWIQNDRSTDTK